jgi:hypothetical protein
VAPDRGDVGRILIFISKEELYVVDKKFKHNFEFADNLYPVPEKTKQTCPR